MEGIWKQIAARFRYTRGHPNVGHPPAEVASVAAQPTINEVDFCAQIASTINHLIAQNPSTYPFREARVEGYGTGSRKRKDLRICDEHGKLVFCGEVKLPGTPEGRSPFDNRLMKDARDKADDAGVRYFFTWNVNKFVLFDSRQWDKPLLDRRMFVRELPRTLAGPKDVAREENLTYIKTEFLPSLLRALADTLTGDEPGWLPPDDIFLRSLESHLDWPVQLAAAHIRQQAEKSKPYEARVQKWMRDQDWPVVGKDHDEWPQLVENMAKTLAYVWSNRLIFYKALSRRFTDLRELRLPPRVKTADDALAALTVLLTRAAVRSGDYEPLLIPDADDWATKVVFEPPNAIDAWRGLITGLEDVDFEHIPSDVLGHIFQKLIGPEERHRYGQHFTGDDAVDLINSFCIHAADAAVLDPACGSGSFLVRAYYRKRTLGPDRIHADRIAGLFGCDISAYPAHLATLNLAAREIVEEANYPRIARRNFFDFDPEKPFCHLPENAGGAITLPPLDAVVGNPPYVRHEHIDKEDKKRFGLLAAAGWPGLELAGRSDLYCYFWPQAARLLKPNGYFGFLTSSSWLDVEYGFAIQGWMLRHFRILAVMESAAEPWFEDARVKTCATILERCEDDETRMKNVVRFVRFDRKLADIIGLPPGTNEDAR
jgi:methylase of polypeptide subunit release factors